jgi:hypothetical protein
MQLNHVYSCTTAAKSGISKVTATCWAPTGKKLAMVTTDRYVKLYDENGKEQDKFPTKPADKVIIKICPIFSNF